MIHKTTLTEKLVTYFLLLNITAILVVGLLSYINSRDALIIRTFDQLTSVKFAKKKQIENFFNDRMNEINFFSKLEQLSAICDLQSIKIHNYYKTHLKSKNVIDSQLNDIQRTFNNYNYFTKLLILTKSNILIELPSQSGSSVKISDSLNYSCLFSLKSNEVNSNQIIEILDSSSGILNSLFLKSHILSYDNNYLGALFFEVNKEQLNKIMLETNPKEGLGNTGESYIIGKNFMMRTKSRFLNDSSAVVTVKSQGAEKAVAGKDGALIYKDYRNMDVLGSFGKLNINNLDWYILAEIDLDEANEPIVNMRNSLLVLTLFIAAIVFILTYFISRKITVPIIKLTEATNRIVEGNYNEQVELISSDEIGALTLTFNKLSSTLKEQEIEIERERQKRSLAAIEALDKERQRLSRELHDGLGQTLISQKLKLENIDLFNFQKSAEVLSDVKKSIDSTINEVRHICNNLMPAVLFEFGLVNAIRKLCNDINEYGNMEIKFLTELHNDTMDDKTKVYLFRITQEGLKNSLQHSKASKCKVELKNEPGFIILKITDNGIGFNKDRYNEGNGLINIRERVNLLQGTFIINSGNNSGTELIVKITSGEELEQN